MLICYSYRRTAGGNTAQSKSRAAVQESVLDLPAWSVHPTHHAPHGVPPEDGDIQVLAGAPVVRHLAVVIGPLLEERQPAVQCSQVPPHGWVGHHDHPLVPGFATGCRLHVGKIALLPVVGKQRGQGILLEGAVLVLPYWQTSQAALEQQGGGEDDRYDGWSHGSGLQTGGGFRLSLSGALAGSF